MRHGRTKAARRTLRFYFLNASIQPPYKILLDGNVLVTSIRLKLPLRERIQKTLQNEPLEFFICRSALDELDSVISSASSSSSSSSAEWISSMQEAYQLGIKECTILEGDDLPGRLPEIEEEAQNSTVDRNRGNNKKEKNSSKSSKSAATEDIKRLVNTQNKQQSSISSYFVITQDDDLAHWIRSNVPFIPLLRIMTSSSLVLLESPTSLSRRFAARMERTKERMDTTLMTSQEKDAIDNAKVEQYNAKRKSLPQKERHQHQHHHQSRKKRKARNPNPLSCKKKKLKTSS